MAYGDLSAAEKGFKRALLMVERSYKIDTHLRSTLLANLSNVHRISGNKDSCLHYIEQLLPLLSPNYKVQKQASVDISTLNPAESQEALDQFWKELTQPVSHNDDITKGDPKKITTDSSTVPEKFYNCKHLFTSVRKIQFILLTGHCIGTMRLHEEGLIYMNMAFEAILSNSLIEHAGCDLLVKDSFILSAALMKLADLSNHSHVTRRKGISAKHIEHDHVARLFKLPYFRDKYPSISDLDISLTSSFRDLKNAATQVYKSKISQQLTVKSIVRGDSEYERMLFSNIGVVGIALLDIEHYAAKHSSPNA